MYTFTKISVLFLVLCATAIGGFAFLLSDADDRGVSNPLSVYLQATPSEATDITLPIRNPTTLPLTIVAFETPCQCSQPVFLKKVIEPGSEASLSATLDTFAILGRLGPDGNFPMVPLLEDSKGNVFRGNTIHFTFFLQLVFTTTPSRIFLSSKGDAGAIEIHCEEFESAHLELGDVPTYLRCTSSAEDGFWTLYYSVSEFPLGLQGESVIPFSITRDSDESKVEGRIPVLWVQGRGPTLESSNSRLNAFGRNAISIPVNADGPLEFVGFEVDRQNGIENFEATFKKTDNSIVLECDVIDSDFASLTYTLIFAAEAGESFNCTGNIYYSGL